MNVKLALVLSLALTAAALAPSRAAEPSRSAAAALPQLSAETNTAPLVPMKPEAVTPSANATAPNPVPTAADPARKNPLWLVLAVVAVLVASSLIKRLVRARPSN
jgi:hypothetical protein